MITRDSRAARKISVVAIGESHLAALARAYASMAKTLPVRIHFMRVDQQEYRPPLDKKGKLNPRIAEILANAKPKLILSCIGGNTHNVLGLVKHPRPFDVVLPEEPDLPLEDDAEIIPSDLIRETFRERLEKGPFIILRTLRRNFDVRIFHLEPPPPLPRQHILRNPGSFFGARIQSLGVAPAALRYKLWRLHSAVLLSFCRDSGIEFVPVPAQTLDPEGMLVERAWGLDPTHGNEWFGAQAIMNALSLAGVRAFRR